MGNLGTWCARFHRRTAWSHRPRSRATGRSYRARGAGECLGSWTGAERDKGQSPEGTPTRTGRAVGRIEHWLLDRGRSSTLSDLRPSPEPPHHTIKVTDVSIYGRWPGLPEGYPGPPDSLLLVQRTGAIAPMVAASHAPPVGRLRKYHASPQGYPPGRGLLYHLGKGHPVDDGERTPRAAPGTRLGSIYDRLLR